MERYSFEQLLERAGRFEKTAEPDNDNGTLQPNMLGENNVELRILEDLQSDVIGSI